MQKTRILVVEDDPAGLQTLSDLLAVNDFTVLAALSAEEGLARARADRPDLIIADLVMPKMDGFALIAALRRSSETWAIPIIAVTASIEYSTLQKAIELGADSCIEKPFTENAIMCAIRAQMVKKALLSQVAVLHETITQELQAPLAALSSDLERLQRSWPTQQEPQRLAQLDNLVGRSRQLAQRVEDLLASTSTLSRKSN